MQQNQHKVTTHKTTHVCTTCSHCSIAKLYNYAINLRFSKDNEEVEQ